MAMLFVYITVREILDVTSGLSFVTVFNYDAIRVRALQEMHDCMVGFYGLHFLMYWQTYLQLDKTKLCLDLFELEPENGTTLFRTFIIDQRMYVHPKTVILPRATGRKHARASRHSCVHADRERRCKDETICEVVEIGRSQIGGSRSSVIMVSWRIPRYSTRAR
jgi:hypothetical protein